VFSSRSFTPRAFGDKAAAFLLFQPGEQLFPSRKMNLCICAGHAGFFGLPRLLAYKYPPSYGRFSTQMIGIPLASLFLLFIRDLSLFLLSTMEPLPFSAKVRP